MHLVGFIIKKFVTMQHGHRKVKICTLIRVQLHVSVPTRTIKSLLHTTFKNKSRSLLKKTHFFVITHNY